MKLLSLEVENFKRLRCVEITPDGKAVVFTGENGAGKSSGIDAIFWALGGRKARERLPRPVRNGTDEARVKVVLGDSQEEVELVVERTETADGRKALKVTDAGGKSVPSPQTVLDALGELIFEPLTFLRASPKEQVQMLLEATGQKELLEELALEREEAYDERRLVNREVKRLEALVKSHGDVDPNIKPKDGQDLLNRLEEAQEAQARRLRLLDTEQARLERSDALIQEAEELEGRARQLREEAAKANSEAMLNRHEAEQVDLPDVEILKAELQDVEQHNEAARKAGQVRKDQETLEASRKQSQELSQKIEKVDKIKQEVIEKADLPVPDLAVDEDGVTYQGVPLVQASQADSLDVAFAICTALNPQLRLVQVRDGSWFTKERFEAFLEMAEKYNMQPIVERPGKDGEVGILIEDGAVVPGQEVEA